MFKTKIKFNVLREGSDKAKNIIQAGIKLLEKANAEGTELEAKNEEYIHTLEVENENIQKLQSENNAVINALKGVLNS